MLVIDKNLLDSVSEKARNNDRKRQNHNFHSNGNDPINRLLNALEPETWVRPHRHLTHQKKEIFIVLRGKLAFYTFGNDGDILSCTVLSPDNHSYGIEINPDVWHSLIVLEKNTVIYDIKQGPFMPIPEEDFAAWAPKDDNINEVKSFMNKLRLHLENLT